MFPFKHSCTICFWKKYGTSHTNNLLQLLFISGMKFFWMKVKLPCTTTPWHLPYRITSKNTWRSSSTYVYACMQIFILCQYQMQSTSEVHGHMKTGNSTTKTMKMVSSKILFHMLRSIIARSLAQTMWWYNQSSNRQII